ncbi:MAG TPA: cytochrome c peroxidase [Beijerinckiaceae bacterium]
MKPRFVLAVLPLAAVLSASGVSRHVGADDAPAAWRAAFARPSAIPAPPGNPVTPQKVDLGRALFTDTRLSGDGTMACVTCHDPALSFSDGVARRPGHDGEPLPRRTPSLWNLAWGLTFFWDGRAPKLEAQASGPIENVREMGGDIAKAATRLAADPGMTARFAAAFPEDPRVTEGNIRAALASFERTLVSPKTRFDAWVEGDRAALDPEERSGFALFVGKAGCVACHKGWRFTDEAFHDIGLAGVDLGRGEALKLHAADHAFKTPSLRERVWTAPYMHDGSLATLEAVVAHYAERVIERPTLSADLKRRIDLSPAERGQLVAFLATLSSDDPPRPAAMPAQVQTLGTPAGHAVAASEIRQKGRRFTPGSVLVALGQALRFVNDDSRTHNVRVDDPRMPAFSEAQEPGDAVVLGFPEAGEFAVTCGIHPEMRLEVTVR